ncbi:hypothetical protein F5Y17DRAFT_351669 [Xylariaceae sp. FL0594]|nr:hypothetical protein F5Y17DRAFT_351669 [Xylariaceae sp. FL0594]
MQQAHPSSVFGTYCSDVAWRNIATVTDTAVMGGLGAMEDDSTATVTENNNMAALVADNSWMGNAWEESLFGMTPDFTFSQSVRAQPTTTATEAMARTIHQPRLSGTATDSSSDPSPQTPMLDASTLSPTTTSTSDSLKESPLSFSKTNAPSGAPPCPCPCLKTLITQLCHLDNLETQSKGQIQIDTALRETDGTIGCARRVLNCDSCHPDSKVLLLLAKVLQTVMNWIQMEYQQPPKSYNNNRDLKNTIPRCSFLQDRLRDGPQAPRPSPPAIVVQVGAWKVPEEDQVLVKDILTNRVLARSSSVLAALRLRADEMALEVAASADSTVYHTLNVEPVQQMLQRLAVTIQGLGQHFKLESQSWQ